MLSYAYVSIQKIIDKILEIACAATKWDVYVSIYPPFNKLIITFLLNKTNWLKIANVSKYCVNAQPKSPMKDRFKLEWNNNAKTAAKIIKYQHLIMSKSWL